MKEIQLTQGKIAFVDDEDFERISKFKWHAAKNHNTFYAQRGSWDKKKRKQTAIKMESEIMGKLPLGLMYDHRDGNGLNVQKENLRVVTCRQNGQNRHQQKTSRYPGVHWKKRNEKWCAQISVEGKVKHIGLFDSEYLAFSAYQEAAYSIEGREVLCG